MKVISFSHKLCPLSVREVFSLGEGERDRLVPYLSSHIPSLAEIVILDTCNRTELYFNDESSVREMIEGLCSYRQVSVKEYEGYMNRYQDEDAIRHLIRVICGMDSMVLGDDDIARQVKEAYGYALENGYSGHEFNIIFQRALEAAKSIKTGTGLSQTPVSVATLTAHEVLSRSEKESKVLIFGITGSMGGRIAKSLLESGRVHVTGTYRKHRNSSLPFTIHSEQTDRLSLVPFDERYEAISEADIIVSATTSPHLIVTAGEYLERCMNKNNKLFIDLAVPPDMDRDLGKIRGCTYMDIDYFEQLSRNNNSEKKRLVQASEQSIDEWTADISMDLIMRKLAGVLPDINKKILAQGGVDEMVHSLRKTQDVDVVRSIAEWLCSFASEEEK